MHTFYIRRVRLLKLVALVTTMTCIYLIKSHADIPDCSYTDRYADPRRWSVSTNVLQTPPPPVGQITMVMCMLKEELPYFKMMMKYWMGPISVTVYTADPERTAKEWSEDADLQARPSIKLHLVVQQGEYYPRNLLMNVALENTFTEYVFLSDVGEVPCPDMYKRLISYIATQGYIRLRKWDQGLVIPAFEGDGGAVPANKSMLLKKVISGEMTPYERPHNMFKGSSRTDFNTWYKATLPYEINYVKGYAPNIVLRRAAVPLSNTNILGATYDKLSFHAQLYVAGVRLTVLPDVFLVRTPYPIHHNSKEMIDREPELRCTANEFLTYRKRLEEIYCGQTLVHESNQTIMKQKYCRKKQVWDMVDIIYTSAYK